MKKWVVMLAAVFFVGTLAAENVVFVTLDPADPTPITSATVTQGDTFNLYVWVTTDSTLRGFSIPFAFKSPVPSTMWESFDADSAELYPPFNGWLYAVLKHGWYNDVAEFYFGGLDLFGMNIQNPGTYLVGRAEIVVDPNFTGDVILDTCVYMGNAPMYLNFGSGSNVTVNPDWTPVTFTVQPSGPPPTPSDTLHVANYGDVATINLPSGGDYDIWFYEPGTRGPSLHIYFHNITVGGDLNLAVYNNAYPNTINSINKYWSIDFTGTADSYDLDFYYLDTDVPAGLDETQFHAWRLDMGVPQWVDMGGTPDAVNNMVTGVSTTELSPWTLGPPGVTAVEEGAQVPRVFFLNQNTPNPFWGRTTIAFGLPKAADVSLVVYNAAGQKVRTLVSGHKNAGTYTVTWDGRDDAGRPVAAGAYFFKFQAGEYQSLKKTLLLK